nr:copia protein [Tanacetum cinerariifolium]
MIIKKDSKIVKAKGERKSLALKAKKEFSDEECSTSKSKDEEYAMVVRDFKKFFKRRDRFVRQPRNKKRRSKERKIRTKEHSSEVLGAIAMKKVKDETCLVAQASKRRLCHANMRLIQSLSSKELVRNLHKLKFDQQFCDACKIRKQANASHKDKNIVSTTRCLELLHMNLFGPSTIRSYGGNRYTLAIVDDYSRNMTIIGTKLVFRNKLDENGIVSQNKARLVAQGYNQQEGIDYDETYAPVARLESIRILLAYACALEFKLFQMDVKSAFLHGFINEEVYVPQPPGFIDFEKPDHVYKLKKALYGSWYPKGTVIETVIYADSDHAGDYVDRKSISGICTFMGCCLTSWFSKKQTALIISTTESEYVSAEKALWMKQTLIDYDIRFDEVPIMCDNNGVIELSKNPMQHSRTKHIIIRHHFLREMSRKDISLSKK